MKDKKPFIYCLNDYVMKPPPKIWSKVMKDLYGVNYCFVEECNYIWGGQNHAFAVEWFNLESFPMVINLN